MLRSTPMRPSPTSFMRCPLEIESLPADVNVKDTRVLLALYLIHSSLTFRISEIAVKLNLSTSRLSHLFKQELGFPPGSYSRRLRLARAKGLLETTLLSVKEITVEIGCNDVSHFVRDYKSFYGLTPSQTRAAFRSRGAFQLEITDFYDT